ncbi:MAG TPA: class I SAM-dependent methyltransferase [Bryobacteraceae bacterium]|nr:class I SAM-dependent methyltransferase [Bryobacteraceae bacterium]
MQPTRPEFDAHSGSYEDLLCDPIRERFSGGGVAFFHTRKRDLIREFFRRRRIDTRALAYLDLGCGKGELATALRGDFSRVAGCDLSAGMIEAGGLGRQGMDVRLQTDPARIPFEDACFDLVTAVCVFHHVPPVARTALTAEVRRVLKPNGVFAIIEHNPYNPVTRRIVNRTPVDSGAILLKPAESRALLAENGFSVESQSYFLYLPQSLYRRIGLLESALAKLPLGGQYAVFSRAL